MQFIFSALALLIISGGNAQQRSPTFLRPYECVQGNRCERTARPIDLTKGPVQALPPSQHTSLQACRLVCLVGAGLWPIPTGPFTTGIDYVQFNPTSFQFLYINDLADSARSFVSNAIETFQKNIQAICKPTGSGCQSVDRKMIVHFKIESSSDELDWETNEGYELEISISGPDVSAVVSAPTIFGARHALETLSQLIVSTPALSSDEADKLVVLESAQIRDKPVFQHRGLLIDTGRNYLPVADILRTIDGLSSVKMNVLHWHATDSQSFPLEIKNLPFMVAYGAYDPEKIYTVEDTQMIVKYAKSRGVRIILEIDSPSHAGAGWEWGELLGLGRLAVCVNRQPWRDYCVQPPCGQLNPINPNTFKVLRVMYKELLETFGRNGVMHLGGDELFIDCWNATEEVTTAMSKLGFGRGLEDFIKIWSTVHNKQLEMLNEEAANGAGGVTDKVIVWSSQLTAPERIENYLNKSNFIVQTWVESDKDLNERLLELGYQLIISTKNAWYLDHGFWGVTKYHTWRDVYNNQIPQKPGVLGGEACMWGEYVFDGNLDSRLWPRTAAVAERLWSDPAKIGTAEAEPRLQAQIARLRRKMIEPEAVAPEWCNQHEGQCL